MSTRFNTVHPGRAPLPGRPRFTTVVFDMSKTTGKTPGSSRSIRHHPGPSRWTTVQPPVLPGSPRSMDRGEPGSTGSPVGLGHNTISTFPSNYHCNVLHGTCLRSGFILYSVPVHLCWAIICVVWSRLEKVMFASHLQILYTCILSITWLK